MCKGGRPGGAVAMRILLHRAVEEAAARWSCGASPLRYAAARTDNLVLRRNKKPPVSFHLMPSVLRISQALPSFLRTSPMDGYFSTEKHITSFRHLPSPPSVPRLIVVSYCMCMHSCMRERNARFVGAINGERERLSFVVSLARSLSRFSVDFIFGDVLALLTAVICSHISR